jgi:hypothetical protein
MAKVVLISVDFFSILISEYFFHKMTLLFSVLNKVILNLRNKF